LSDSYFVLSDRLLGVLSLADEFSFLITLSNERAQGYD